MLKAKKSLLATAVAAVSVSVSHSALAQSGARGEKSPLIEEVLVTATRREANVLDIPYNITAVSADQIVNAGITDLQGVTRLVPGLATPDLGPRANSLNNNMVIRGLNATQTQTVAPTLAEAAVSTYIDEIPLFVNLKLTDIQRVEILRGPQATLYGAGSVGGTLRMIFNKPDTESTQFDLSGYVAGMEHSDEESYSLDAIINLPLTDNLAFRASAGYEEIGGFTDADNAVVYDGPLDVNLGPQPVLANPDDPLTSGMVFQDLEDYNGADTWYFRGSLLWDITEDVEAQLTYMRQEDTSDGFSVETLGTDHTNSQFIPVAPMDREVELTSLTLIADLGFATITSATGFTTNEYEDINDTSNIVQDLALYYGFYPRLSSPLYTFNEEESFVQEVRIASNSSDSNWDWLLGAFYTDRETSLQDPQTVPGFAAWSELPGSAEIFNQAYAGYPGFPYETFGDFLEFFFFASRPSSLTPTDYSYTFERDIELEDRAIFGEVTYRLTDKWQITGGFRWFDVDFSQQTYQELPICGAFCSEFGDDPRGGTPSEGAQSTSDTIFKFNTSYDVNSDTMVYFTVAEGFRRGGGNALPIGTCAACEPDGSLIEYDPDTATNYELGVKGTLADRVTYSLGLYRIDWDNVQVDTFSPASFTALVVNGDTARSQGLELESTAQVTSDFTVSMGYSYVDAELTSDFQASRYIGRKGDTLPNVPEHQFTLAADYFQSLDGGLEIHYHFDGFYRSEVTTNINDLVVLGGETAVDPARAGFAELDGFAVANASIGLNNPGKWEVRAFVDNIADEIGITGVQGLAQRPNNSRAFVIRPRTYGLRFSYSFN